MPAFDGKRWVRNWEALGGRVTIEGDRLGLYIPDESHSALAELLEAARQHDSWRAAVRFYLAGRP